MRSCALQAYGRQASVLYLVVVVAGAVLCYVIVVVAAVAEWRSKRWKGRSALGHLRNAVPNPSLGCLGGAARCALAGLTARPLAIRAYGRGQVRRQVGPAMRISERHTTRAR